MLNLKLVVKEPQVLKPWLVNFLIWPLHIRSSSLNNRFPTSHALPQLLLTIIYPSTCASSFSIKKRAYYSFVWRRIPHCRDFKIHSIFNWNLKPFLKYNSCTTKVLSINGFNSMCHLCETTLSKIISVTYYLELHKATYVYYTSHFVPTRSH